jgi:hypothetical protein
VATVPAVTPRPHRLRVSLRPETISGGIRAKEIHIIRPRPVQLRRVLRSQRQPLLRAQPPRQHRRRHQPLLRSTIVFRRRGSNRTVTAAFSLIRASPAKPTRYVCPASRFALIRQDHLLDDNYSLDDQRASRWRHRVESLRTKEKSGQAAGRYGCDGSGSSRKIAVAPAAGHSN